MATSKRLNSGDIRRLRRSLGITAFYDLPLDDAEIVVSAGGTSNSVSELVFSNSNNVTFGLSGGTITAQAGTGGLLSNINISAGALSSNVSAVTFSNGSGVSFGFDGSNVTASVFTNYQSTGNYLTTAMASNRGSDFVQATAGFHGTNASGTIASSGISVSVASVATDYAGTGFTSATTSGTNVVGTLNNGGLSVGVPAYLTTAAQSGQTSNFAGTNTSLQTTSGTDLKVTLNTTGLTVAYPAWITTYANDLTSGRAGTNTSVATTSGTDLTLGVNTSGVTIGYPKWITTYVNDLTSARAGTNTSVQTTSGTDLSCALNTSGLTIAYPAWLTTAAATNITSARAGTNTSVQTTSGTDLSCALNTSGLTIAYPAWLTTAAATNITSARAGTNTSVATTSGTDITLGVNTSGVTIGYPAWITTQTIQSAIKGVGVSNTGNTAGNVGYSTGINYALAGSGLLTLSQSTAAGAATCYIQHPAWLTTAALSGDTSKYAGTATSVATTTGTDLSMALNTNGLTVAYAKWITTAMASNAATISNINVSAGSISRNLSAITFSDGSGISWGLNTNSVITATVQTNYLTTARASTDAIGLNTSIATVAGTDLAMTGNSSGLTINYAKWITTAAQSSGMMSYFENMPILEPGSTTLSASGSVLQVVPFVLQNAISIGFLRIPVSMSYVSTEVSGTTANSTWTVNVSYTDAAAIMVQKAGASSLSLQYLTSSSATWVFQNQIGAGAQGSRYTVTQNVSYPISGTTSNYTTSYPQSSANVQLSSASLTLFTGARWLDIPFAVSLSAGNYWLALGRSNNSATQAGNAALGGASAGFSYIGVSQNNLTIGFPGAVTNSSIQLQPGLGSWSTNAAVISSSSLQLASISAMSSGPKPYFQMIRYA